MAAEDDEGVVLIETRDTPPAHYLFKVKSFSLFSENGVDQIQSNNFKAGGHYCNILLFPEGNDRGKGDHVSIYLTMENTSSLPDGEAVNAIFKFFLFDQIRGKYMTVQGSARRFDRVKYRWGFDKFISLEAFKDPTNGYLVNNTSIFGVEVFVPERSCLGECLSISKVANISCKYEWVINQFSELGEKHYSDEFAVRGYKWKLLLCPVGSSLSLFLVSVDAESSTAEHQVKAQFTLTLNNQFNQNYIQMRSSFWFGASRQKWGWRSFIELKDLKDGFMVKDRCIFEAEVKVLCETSHETKLLTFST